MDNQQGKIKAKPKFKRRQFLLKKLKDKWRKPKGLHNKLRLRKKGKGKVVRIGYGTSNKNKEIMLIKNIQELENAKKEIIISSGIGLKKKLEIIKKSKEMKLNILNIKDVDKFVQDKEKMRGEKKEEKTKRKKKKEEKSKKEEIKKKEGLSKEDKEKKEKEERKQVLEKGL
jgi:large subunit ribosomal protein L32e